MTTSTLTIPAELTDQQSSLTELLASIGIEQSKLAGQKLEVETSLRRIDTAIKFLRGESIPLVATPGARKPMSQSGKDAIRAGLLAAAARKRDALAAVVAVPQPTETASEPAVVPDSTAKSSTGRKAAKG